SPEPPWPEIGVRLSAFAENVVPSWRWKCRCAPRQFPLHPLTAIGWPATTEPDITNAFPRCSYVMYEPSASFTRRYMPALPHLGWYKAIVPGEIEYTVS